VICSEIPAGEVALVAGNKLFRYKPCHAPAGGQVVIQNQQNLIQKGTAFHEADIGSWPRYVCRDLKGRRKPARQCHRFRLFTLQRL
jgi:hypothetical protein